MRPSGTELVSVVVPTLNRPRPLARALASLLAQMPPQGVRIEILVIDNSQDRSAEAHVTPLLGGGGHDLRYLSEPVPGVANARNTGVREAAGRWIAFLDDDEEAAPDWIARHVAALTTSGADASFGPVEAAAEEGAIGAAFADFFSRRIDRPDGSDITDLSAYLGTNNSVFDKAACFGAGAPFDISLNEVGGEDSLMLKQAAEGGRRFVWAAGAKVTEWVPPRRLNWAYVHKRRFLSGQIRSFVHHKVSPVQWRAIAFWMAAGAAQAAAGGAAGLVLRLVDGERSKKALGIAWGGLGKLFWGSRLRPKLYGSGLVS